MQGSDGRTGAPTGRTGPTSGRHSPPKAGGGKDPEFRGGPFSAGIPAFGLIRTLERQTPFAALRAPCLGPVKADGNEPPAALRAAVPAPTGRTGQRSAFPDRRCYPDRWRTRGTCIFTATGPASGRHSPAKAGGGEEPRSWGRSPSRRESRVLRHSSLSRRRCVPLASPARTHKKPAGWRVSRGAPDPTLPAGSGPCIAFLSTFRIPWTPGRFWRRPPGSGCLLTRQTGRRPESTALMDPCWLRRKLSDTP